MALVALIAGWCLPGPAGGDRAEEPARLFRTVATDCYRFDPAHPRYRPDTSVDGQQAGATVAMLGDIDDDAEECSSSPAVFPVYRHELAIIWSHTQTRLGAGQVRHVSTERILLRC